MPERILLQIAPAHGFIDHGLERVQLLVDRSRVDNAKRLLLRARCVGHGNVKEILIAKGGVSHRSSAG